MADRSPIYKTADGRLHRAVRLATRASCPICAKEGCRAWWFEKANISCQTLWDCEVAVMMAQENGH